MTLRPINLRTVISESLSKSDTYTKYMKYLDINFSQRETECIASLLSKLDDTVDLSEFFVGFKIPQINKEFDLLRFYPERILNIELKNGQISDQDIKKQLVKNLYYLEGFSGNRSVDLYTYRVDTDQLFCLNKDKLVKGDWVHLNQILQFSPEVISNINVLCNPAEYLVSPFNTTDKFLKNQYFLTQAQQEIKSNILLPGPGTYSIRGNAGTGKTLLVYDIAKKFMDTGKKVIICHCGILNEGQIKLKGHGWQIIGLKSINQLIQTSIKNYDVVIIDEVQRIKKSLLTEWFTKFSQFSGKVILSGDPRQYLHSSENGNESFEYINSHLKNDHTYSLKDKIRSNEEVAAFIMRLFNLNANTGKSTITPENIYVEYFENKVDGISYAKHLTNKGWQVISPTTSLYTPEYYSDIEQQRNTQNSHHVIGQEFDKVVTFIGPNFHYDHGKLHGDQTYYSSSKMLFENVTRTRTKLCLIVIQNIEVLSNILDILNQNELKL